MRSFLIVSIFVLVVSMFGWSWQAAAEDIDALGGWQILQADYDQHNWLDVVSYEWDYYTFTDEKSGVNAVIGYLVSNPRGRLSDIVQLLPDGGNIAFVGQIGGQRATAEYVNFGLDNYEASADERFFSAEDPATGNYGLLTPLRQGGPNGEDMMELEGQTSAFAWDLAVTQEWADRIIPGGNVVVGTDVGSLPGEVWTEAPIWHRIHVTGTVEDRLTGEVYSIDGHGNRHIAWGRYLLTVDGWDAFYFNERDEDLAQHGLDPDQGVSIVGLAYHKSEILDFADVSFYDQDELQVYKFRAADGEMGWYHRNWTWDSLSWQCVPLDGYWVLDNGEYRIEITQTIGNSNMGTLLSDITLPVAVYFIDELFPYYQGRITHIPSGRLVREFAGRGVGEFAFHKSARLWPASTLICNLWGRSLFSNPIP